MSHLNMNDPQIQAEVKAKVLAAANGTLDTLLALIDDVIDGEVQRTRAAAMKTLPPDGHDMLAHMTLSAYGDGVKWAAEHMRAYIETVRFGLDSQSGSQPGIRQ